METLKQGNKSFRESKLFFFSQIKWTDFEEKAQ